MTDRKLMQQALHTLEGWANVDDWVWPETAKEQAKRNTVDAIAALRERLAQPEQKLLTEKRIEELYSFWVVDCQDIVGFARAIERSNPQMQPCAGRNCGSTNPNLHSAECFEDYEKSTGMATQPVAWMGAHDKTDLYYRKPPQADVIPLYTAPPQRKLLTDAEIALIAAACGGLASDFVVDVARAIEAAHGIKEKK